MHNTDRDQVERLGGLKYRIGDPVEVHRVRYGKGAEWVPATVAAAYEHQVSVVFADSSRMVVAPRYVRRARGGRD